MKDFNLCSATINTLFAENDIKTKMINGSLHAIDKQGNAVDTIGWTYFNVLEFLNS